MKPKWIIAGSGKVFVLLVFEGSLLCRFGHVKDLHFMCLTRFILFLSLYPTPSLLLSLHSFPFLCLPSPCISLFLSPPSFPISFPPALNMASILQKLITPLFSGTPEPARNKVTVVGVGQVGMACAVSILLRVRKDLLCLYSCQITIPTLPPSATVLYSIIVFSLPHWHWITLCPETWL